MVKQGSEEMLRQSVFSSIHMSTSLKCSQVSISYPCCSFCGGVIAGNKKSDRKVAVCQLSLYTNSSESFIVWSKKPEEPKGILWLHSCCIRRGSDIEGNMPIELLSKGCRGRCSYTLRFASRIVAEDWYRLLKQESKKNTPTENDDPFSSDSGEEEPSPLDSILSETQLELYDEETLFIASISSRKTSLPAVSIISQPSPEISKPVKKPSSKNKTFKLPFSSSLMDRKISLPSPAYHPNTTVESPISPDSDAVARWSLRAHVKV